MYNKVHFFALNKTTLLFNMGLLKCVLLIN